MRGDRPFEYYNCCWELGFTPHARGSTQWSQHQPEVWAVYPACAGIDRGGITVLWILLRLPRMRGDRPDVARRLYKEGRFTPHARGSTPTVAMYSSTFFVYPACAGIDPFFFRYLRVCRGLPRMRGDRPDEFFPWKEGYSFTPHARGSTVDDRRGHGPGGVYPACAGIDLCTSVLKYGITSLPRMRGDRPS